MPKVEEISKGVYAGFQADTDSLAVMLRKLLIDHPEDPFVICQMILSREYAEKIIFALSGDGKVH